MLGFQFHFNRFNSVEKIVDEKNDIIHPSAPTQWKNRTFWPLDETPYNFWQNRHVLKFNPIEYYNLYFDWDHGFRSLYLRTVWSQACRETDYNTFPHFALDKVKNVIFMYVFFEIFFFFSLIYLLSPGTKPIYTSHQ